ncbi:hypothetical protein [Arthrobacter pigmenti]
MFLAISSIVLLAGITVALVIVDAQGKSDPSAGTIIVGSLAVVVLNLWIGGEIYARLY